MSVAVGTSAELANRMLPAIVEAGAAERPITVDQTNASVVVAETVVVKWLTPPVPEPHPAQLVLAHLQAVGFTEVPAFHGMHTVDGMVEAVVTGYVAGALDGWDWCVDDLTAALTSSATFTEPLRWAERAGAVSARLHLALATPSTIVPEPVGLGSPAVEHDRGLSLLQAALACTAGTEGGRLAERATAIRALIDTISHIGEVDQQLVHGDLHVGQLLRAGDQLFVNDFDGSPVADAAMRRARRTPVVDLASLLQSFDHVGRVVAKRRPADADAIDTFIAAALAACRAGYERLRPLTAAERQLLAPLRAIQELHEFVYASRSLPRWLYVPDAALTAMFPNP